MSLKGQSWGDQKKDRPTHPMGVKGGCSPQNNNIFGFFGVKFRKNVEKPDLNRFLPGKSDARFGFCPKLIALKTTGF
jgi:hypothetical protein